MYSFQPQSKEKQESIRYEVNKVGMMTTDNYCTTRKRESQLLSWHWKRFDKLAVRDKNRKGNSTPFLGNG